MENTHIVKSFDRDLNQIESLLLEMGNLVKIQLANSITALIEGDLELANQIVQRDKKVDALEKEISEQAVSTLALRHPMAEDLRRVVSALKVSANLERVGDYAKNIAKRTHVLSQIPPIGASTSTMKHMSGMVQKMIGEVLEAYIARDVKVADEIRLRDEEVDQLHNSLFRELLTYMMEDASDITACMHLLFIAKNIERAGDQTTTIAEQVHYLVTGSLPEADRPKGDQTSTMNITPDNTDPQA